MLAFDNQLTRSQLRKNGIITEWIVLAGCLCLLGGFIGLWLVTEKNATLQREFDRLTSQTELVSASLTRQFLAIEFAHDNIKEEVLDGLITSTNRSVFIEKRLNAFVQTLPLAENIKLVNKHQQIVIKSQQAANQLTQVEIALFNQLAKQPVNNNFFLSVLDTNSKQLSLYLASQLVDAENEFHGLLISKISTQHLTSLLNAVVYAADSRALFVNEEGIVFAAANTNKNLLGINLFTFGSTLREHLQTGLVTSLAEVKATTSNSLRLIAHHNFAPAEAKLNQQLVLVISRDSGEVTANFHRISKLILGLFGLIVIASLPALFFVQIKRRAVFNKIQLTEETLLAKNEELEELNAKLTRQSHQLELLAFQDGLTGIANRRTLDEKLNLAWKNCYENKQTLAFIMLDIDHFKKYNDYYGHQQGDVCLRKVAEVLAETFTWPEGKLARFGGEEFACLLPNANLEAALEVAEQLRQAVENLNIEHAESSVAKYVTLSLGVSCLIPAVDTSLAQLVKKADAALYQAKQSGRNQVAS